MRRILKQFYRMTVNFTDLSDREKKTKKRNDFSIFVSRSHVYHVDFPPFSPGRPPPPRPPTSVPTEAMWSSQAHLPGGGVWVGCLPPEFT